MRNIQTDVLVIGGGATGTGILRDLAQRGFACLLVERRDLAYGTTGRYHGLLHSGARYAVKDPLAARECIEENQILRRIMPQCIEDTGGFFVLTAQDDPAYVPLFLNGCKQAGIPAEDVDLAQMLKQEPLLDSQIQQCFRVPDGSADSFMAADLNAESARQYGAKVLTYHEIRNLSTKSTPSGLFSPVIGALCHDLVKDEDVQVDASLVINACGAWAGKVARLAGIRLQMLPGKGTMLALNHRVVNTVINRCRMPSDGDILVP
ncbi:MAG TPA: FAD-dependent oxidoreductase, partial [Anaerolineales bacterium]